MIEKYVEKEVQKEKETKENEEIQPQEQQQQEEDNREKGPETEMKEKPIEKQQNENQMEEDEWRDEEELPSGFGALPFAQQIPESNFIEIEDDESTTQSPRLITSNPTQFNPQKDSLDTSRLTMNTELSDISQQHQQNKSKEIKQEELNEMQRQQSRERIIDNIPQPNEQHQQNEMKTKRESHQIITVNKLKRISENDFPQTPKIQMKQHGEEVKEERRRMKETTDEEYQSKRPFLEHPPKTPIKNTRSFLKDHTHNYNDLDEVTTLTTTTNKKIIQRTIVITEYHLVAFDSQPLEECYLLFKVKFDEDSFDIVKVSKDFLRKLVKQKSLTTLDELRTYVEKKLLNKQLYMTVSYLFNSQNEIEVFLCEKLLKDV